MTRQLAEKVYNLFWAYYVSPKQLNPADILFVFGRNDSDLAQQAFVIHGCRFVKKVLVSGGVGKDSGDLPKLGVTEAAYLAVLMYDMGVPADDILVEQKATNGGENSRFGLQLIREAGVPSERIILLAHPSNGLRLKAVHTFEARKMGFKANYQLAVCHWDFDAKDITHQNLVIGECLRLIEYPLRTDSTGEPDPWSDPVFIPADIVAEVLTWKSAQPK